MHAETGGANAPSPISQRSIAVSRFRKLTPGRQSGMSETPPHPFGLPEASWPSLSNSAVAASRRNPPMTAEPYEGVPLSLTYSAAGRNSHRSHARRAAANLFGGRNLLPRPSKSGSCSRPPCGTARPAATTGPPPPHYFRRGFGSPSSGRSGKCSDSMCCSSISFVSRATTSGCSAATSRCSPGACDRL